MVESHDRLTPDLTSQEALVDPRQERPTVEGTELPNWLV